MVELKQAMSALSHWFARHDIPMESLTLILNIADRTAAGRFDAAFKYDVDREHLVQAGNLSLRGEMQIGGIKLRVESPLHTP